MAICESRKFRGLPQMSDTLPTILTSPSRDQLEDAVDRITLLGRSLLDPGNQQSIDRSQLLARIITLLSRSLGHCRTSLQADPNRALVPRDYANCTQVASVTHEQSRAKLAAVINSVPRLWFRTSFLWTKERLIVSWAEGTPCLHFPAALSPMRCEAAWPMPC